MLTFFHTKHSCGHSAYWSDAASAFTTSAYPCPWCGGETSLKVPADAPFWRDPRNGVMGFREKLPDGRVPWPKDMKDPGPVKTQHRADESCCQDGPKPA
jgi:hypothetical protein